MQTHTDKIWISEPREKQTVKTLVEHVQSCGYTIAKQDDNNADNDPDFIAAFSSETSSMGVNSSTIGGLLPYLKNKC